MPFLAESYLLLVSGPSIPYNNTVFPLATLSPPPKSTASNRASTRSPLQALSSRTQDLFDLHPQLSQSQIAWGVVIQRIELARDHDRRAIQHSVVQPTLGYITE